MYFDRTWQNCCPRERKKWTLLFFLGQKSRSLLVKGYITLWIQKRSNGWLYFDLTWHNCCPRGQDESYRLLGQRSKRKKWTLLFFLGQKSRSLLVKGYITLWIQKRSNGWLYFDLTWHNCCPRGQDESYRLLGQRSMSQWVKGYNIVATKESKSLSVFWSKMTQMLPIMREWTPLILRLWGQGQWPMWGAQGCYA